MKFVDITNDIAFRKIFGNENRKTVLISFLNAILLLDNDKKIVAVDILTPYQLPALKGGKVTIVDVKAKNQNGKNYIVEMQIKNAESLEVIPQNVKDQGLKNAYEDADKHNWTKEELEAYDNVFIREQDERGRITKVQKDIAGKLLKLGLPVDDIIESTGLTIEQIKKLQGG